MYRFKPTRVTLLLLFFPFFLQAQVTLRLTSLPANTPAGATIYVAGSFNNWNPAGTALTPDTDGVLSATIDPPVGLVEYKFTRGGWPTVEGNASGAYLPNRTLQYTGQATTLNLSVQTWEDLGPTGGTVTNELGVSILDDDFYIPQLNRYRRVWIYLPPDYASSTKNYPVLYLQDGQNLFDPSTSFAGEWEVDETLNALAAAGDYGCIVVGIDNGGASRLDEYSPWINAQYGGGEAEAYLEFLTNTLKPHIDQNYRTLPGRQHTGVGGSSMGGLFAQYALIERQDVYSKAAVFSPAFWFGGSASANHVTTTGKNADVRVYFLAGGAEPASVATNMDAVADAMLATGFQSTELKQVVVPGGQHAEWFWAQEFGDAYEWLFANAVSSVEVLDANAGWTVSPNPSTDVLRVAAPDATQLVHFQILGTDGKMWRDSSASGSSATIRIADLPAGLYFLKIQTTQNRTYAFRFLKK
jgi:predicted alpha/beta superfamily hydrolase